MKQQQEQALLEAFRRMNPKRREFAFNYMLRLAALDAKAKPDLRLIVTEPAKH